MLLVLLACAPNSLPEFTPEGGGMEVCLRGAVEAEGEVLAVDEAPPDLPPAPDFDCEGDWTHSLSMAQAWLGWRTWDADGQDTTPNPSFPAEIQLTSYAGTVRVSAEDTLLLSTEPLPGSWQAYGEPMAFEGCVVQERRASGADPGEAVEWEPGVLGRYDYVLELVDHPRHLGADQPACEEPPQLWWKIEPAPPPLYRRSEIAWAAPPE